MESSERFYGLDLKKLNTITKYPSILTYHKMGDRGILEGELQVDFGEDKLFATEKIDGVSSRIIFDNKGDYIIGSREELLYAKGDYIINPSLSIVETLYNEKFLNNIFAADGFLTVFYFEVFGGKVTKASKQYTSTKKVGYRLFDIASICVKDLEGMELSKISGWRESSNSYHSWTDAPLIKWHAVNIFGVDSSPTIDIEVLPKTVKDTLEFLEYFVPKSEVVLDKDALGNPEGIVVRNNNRSKIAKIRFEDYRRSLKKVKK